MDWHYNTPNHRVLLVEKLGGPYSFLSSRKHVYTVELGYHSL